MSPAQTQLYFREWGAVRKHYVSQGIDPKLADAKRHELHKKALGAPKSSKLFTNADLDKVLGVFRAITRPADLRAQLDAIEQPDRRRASALADCYALTRTMSELGESQLKKNALSYIEGIALKVRQKRVAACDAADLAVVRGVLQQRVQQLQKKTGWQPPGALRDVAAQAAEAEGDGNPF